MIIDDYKINELNELEELRHAYYDNLRQLDEMRANLYAHCSKLMEKGADEDFYRVAEITYSSFMDIGAVMQKLEKALEGTSVLVQKCQAYMEAEKDFAELLGDKP